jgi:hypothetical protein
MYNGLYMVLSSAWKAFVLASFFRKRPTWGKTSLHGKPR